jgi:hypothetical protein
MPNKEQLLLLPPDGSPWYGGPIPSHLKEQYNGFNRCYRAGNNFANCCGSRIYTAQKEVGTRLEAGMGITVYLGDIGYQEQAEKHETAVLQTRSGPISISVGTRF